MACRSISSSRAGSAASAAAGCSRRGAHARGQMLRQNQFAAGQQHRPLHRVAQFAHVARPGITFQTGGHRLRKPRAALGQFLDEPARQRQNVLAPLAQRRNVQLHHVQPVKQILAKPAGFDFLLQIAVAGGEDAGVGVDFAVRADALKSPVLRHAQAAWPEAAATSRRFHPEKSCRRSPPQTGRCAGRARR